MRRAWLPALALVAMPAFAHDLITAETAQGYLDRQAALRETIASQGPASARASAWLGLGRMLDEIRELLNRDLEAHGKVQGLASNFLMAELRSRGSPLAWSAEHGRFDANLDYYREALKLSSAPEIAGDASFRLLQGWFYDSFTIDPLAPGSRTPSQLADQVKLGETFRQDHPAHPGREEASFILLVQYIQSARAAGQPKRRAAFSQKARALGEEFVKAYPDSLRSAAIPPLLARLPQN